MEADVSAIIPCYRCSDTIVRACESVACQTLRPAELILVDDGSGDHTLDTLLQIQSAYSRDWVKVIHLERNRGASVARNVAWNTAVCNYVAFLDADDVWHPEKIAFQYSWMRDNSRATATGHKCVMVDPDRPLVASEVNSSFKAHYLSKRKLLLSNPFVTPSFMFKRKLEYRFDPRRKYAEDFLLLLQLGLDGNPIAMLDAELVYVFKKLGKTGISSNLWKMRYGDIKNYWSLWNSQRINYAVMTALTAYSMFKFIILLTFGATSQYALKRLLGKIF
jgi:glycosyltransferase involved in cell wall biosynthesis